MKGLNSGKIAKYLVRLAEVRRLEKELAKLEEELGVRPAKAKPKPKKADRRK